MVQMDDTKLVKIICDYIIKDGTENTDSGNEETGEWETLKPFDPKNTFVLGAMIL